MGTIHITVATQGWSRRLTKAEVDEAPYLPTLRQEILDVTNKMINRLLWSGVASSLTISLSDSSTSIHNTIDSWDDAGVEGIVDKFLSMRTG